MYLMKDYQKQAQKILQAPNFLTHLRIFYQTVYNHLSFGRAFFFGWVFVSFIFTRHFFAPVVFVPLLAGLAVWANMIFLNGYYAQAEGLLPQNFSLARDMQIKDGLTRENQPSDKDLIVEHMYSIFSLVEAIKESLYLVSLAGFVSIFFLGTVVGKDILFSALGIIIVAAITIGTIEKCLATTISLGLEQEVSIDNSIKIRTTILQANKKNLD